MFGDYSYSIFIIEGNSIKECVDKTPDLQDKSIKGYNYNPKEDISHFMFLNDEGNKKKFPNGWKDIKKINLFNKKEIANHPFFKLSYEELLNLNNGGWSGISGDKFLFTYTEGWFDWIKVKGNLPENYSYFDGHSG